MNHITNKVAEKFLVEDWSFTSLALIGKDCDCTAETLKGI